MNSSKILFILLASCFLFTAQAAVVCPKGDSTYFCLPPEENQNKVINGNNFYLIPVKLIGLFSPELSEVGYPVSLAANWESPYFGAGVSLYENSFHLMILGGMTRLPEMTEDAYAAIVCHEIGHIIGGEPRQTIVGANWSSAEGQSDFFSASVCLPRYFKSLGVSALEIPVRIEAAGFDMLNTFKKYDSNSVDKTLSRTRGFMPATGETLINTYPSLQCRYENFKNPSQRAACWYKN